jgi:hexokinase
MIAGAYQGDVIFATARAAAGEGLFSEDFAIRLREKGGFSMREIGEFCADRDENDTLSLLCANESDRARLFDLIDASIERAAKLSAITFTSILAFSGSGTDPRHPVPIVAEGTGFRKSDMFRDKLDRCIEKFIGKAKGLSLEIVEVADATLTGAAVAAMML